MGNQQAGSICLDLCSKVETTSFDRSYLVAVTAHKLACPSCSYMKETKLTCASFCSKHKELCEVCVVYSTPIDKNCVLCALNKSNLIKKKIEKTDSPDRVLMGAKVKTNKTVSIFRLEKQQFISQINSFWLSNGCYRKMGLDKKWTGIHSMAFPQDANQINISLVIDALNFVVGVGSENYETYEHTNFVGFNNYQDGYSFQNKRYKLVGRTIPTGNAFRVKIDCDEALFKLSHRGKEIASIQIKASIFRLPQVFLWVWVYSQNDSIIIL